MNRCFASPECLCSQRLSGANLLIFANKQDVPGAASTQELSRVSEPVCPGLPAEQVLQILDLASLRTHDWHIQGCSAVTGANLDLGFDCLINSVVQRLYHPMPSISPAAQLLATT